MTQKPTAPDISPLGRVVLTGGTGFVGRPTLARLAPLGDRLHVLHPGRPPEDLRQGYPTITWHDVDLLGPDSKTIGSLQEIQPAALLHLAWNVEHGTYWNSPENAIWVAASLKLFAAFLRAGGQRIVGVGTCAEYDWNYGYCREPVTPLAPKTFYGGCKHSLGSLLPGFAAAFGASWAWCRLFFLYGPHEHPKRLVASVCRALSRSEEVTTTSGGHMRDFLHVDDAADALVRVLASTLPGAVNVCSGQPTSLATILDTLGDLSGRGHLIKRGGHPTPPDEPGFLVGDCSRLRSETGWQPKNPLHAGLKETYAWWAGLRRGKSPISWGSTVPEDG